MVQVYLKSENKQETLDLLYSLLVCEIYTKSFSHLDIEVDLVSNSYIYLLTI